MSLIKHTLISAVFGLIWVAAAYFVWGLNMRHRYETAFEATREGDDMRGVLARFGTPSHIELPAHVVGPPVALRFWYEIPFTMGISPVSVDFDSRQQVVGKYQWNSP
jgi:hypothetical protein